MPLPNKIATLLYVFNERDDVLLIEPKRGAGANVLFSKVVAR